MGDNFLKRQARNFQKGRDLATAEANEPTLFDRPELISTVYTAVPAADCQFENGENLFVMQDGERAIIARGHTSVGRIEGDGAQAILGALNESGAAGIIQIRITEVSALSGAAKAVVVKEQ